jgi:hypothetical protein
MTPTTPKWVTGAIVSPNGGLKAAPPPPQKQNSEHTGGGELNGLVYTVTCELDLLCTAAVVVPATNLIYCSEVGRKKDVRSGEIKTNSAKTNAS